MIILKITTPDLQVYELFNHVLILSQGETVYFGGTKEILRWFDTALHRSVFLWFCLCVVWLGECVVWQC